MMSSVRTTLMLILAASGVTAGCWSPRCEVCEVKVDQESPSLVTLDWSHDWWDLNLQCLDSLSLTLNGVPQTVPPADLLADRTSLSLTPCIQYNLTLQAVFKDNTSTMTSPVLVMTRDQPELTSSVWDKIEMSREERSMTVRGLWDDILQDRDCRSPHQAFIRFRAEGQDHWREVEVDTLTDSFTKTVQLAEYCLDYHVQLRIVGFPGSHDLTSDEATLSSKAVDLSDIPPVEDLLVRTTLDSAEISWSASSCVSGFEILVSKGDSCDEACLESNQREEIDNEGGVELDLVYYSKDISSQRLVLSDLIWCSDYVVMVRLLGHSARSGPVTSQVFRVANQSQVFSSGKWLPVVRGLEVDAGEAEAGVEDAGDGRNVSGEESVTISWEQPDCMTQYEVLVVSEAECPLTRPSLQCLEEVARRVRRGEEGEERSVSVTVGNLTDCTQYRAIVRSKEKHKYGAVTGLAFWTLPRRESGLSLRSFTVRSGPNFLQLRWRQPDLACTTSFILKTCSLDGTQHCNTKIVSTHNARSVTHSLKETELISARSDVMRATVQDLAPCTDYSLQIGAGPFVFRDQERTVYSQREEEEALARTISQLWTSEEGTYTGQARTQPAQFLPVTEVKVENRRTAVTVSWRPPACADHFIIKLRKVEDKAVTRTDDEELHQAIPRISDDEDYLSEDGSGQVVSKSNVEADELEYYVDDSEELIINDWSERTRREADYDEIFGLLALDEEEEKAESEDLISVTVSGSSGEVGGLESCTDYSLSVLSVYSTHVEVSSPEKTVSTLCLPDCDFSLSPDLSSEPPVVSMQIPDVSACDSSYQLEVCLRSECQTSHTFNITTNTLDLASLPGLAPLQPCGDYNLRLRTMAGSQVTEKHFAFSSEGLNPPSQLDVTLRAVSETGVTVDLPGGGGCVSGHEVILYSRRHLLTSNQLAQEESLHKVHQVRIPSNQSSVEIREKLRPGGLYTAEIRNIDLLQETLSDPLEMTFQVPCGGESYPEVYEEGEVMVGVVEGGVRFQFLARCVTGYSLSLCQSPAGCRAGEITTTTIPSSQEEDARGHYQYSTNLTSCSVFHWEIVGLPQNVSLRQDYLLTKPDPLTPQPFTLTNGKVSSVQNKIILSWDLTHPCVEEYHIKVCQAGEKSLCWADNFQAPNIREEETSIVIQLTDLSGFHSDALEECGQYLVTVKPVAVPSLQGEVVLPFTFIKTVSPPSSIEVRDVTENTALLTWTGPECSNSEQVAIVVRREGTVVQEYHTQPSQTHQLLQDLLPCSDYFVEVYGLEEGVTSDLPQMMVFITRPQYKGSITVQPEREALVLNIGSDLRKCVQEMRVTTCQSQSERCETLSNCETERIQLNVSQLALGQKARNTYYGVSLLATYHDNSTQDLGEEFCVKTKYGGSLKLETVVASHEMLKFQLNFSQIGKIPDRKQIHVRCKTKDEEEGEELEVEENYEVVLNKVLHDTEYVCHGEVSLSDDTIEIDETTVSTHEVEEAELEADVTEITKDSFRLVVRSNCEDIERYSVLVQPACHSCQCPPPQKISLPASQTSYQHPARPGTRYTLLVRPETEAVSPTSNLSSSLVVETLSGRPHTPTIERVERTGPGRVRVEFSYPCPHTGPTVFSLLSDCSNCTVTRDQDRTFKVSGLTSGSTYNLRVEATVTNCLEEEELHCKSLSPPHLHSVPCSHRCSDGHCLEESDVLCDRVPHCPDLSDERDCPCAGWRCRSGFCVGSEERCDGVRQCSDGSDEEECPACPHNQFSCVRDGGCLDPAQVCDKRVDCWDGSDERDCQYRSGVCWPDGFLCVDGTCVGLHSRCDGLPDCPHGEDEDQCGWCGLEDWRCGDGQCVARTGLCNNVTDCQDGSDEWSNCHCFTLGLAHCQDTGHCLPTSSLCDGRSDCRDGSDERLCQRSHTVSSTYQGTASPSLHTTSERHQDQVETQTDTVEAKSERYTDKEENVSEGYPDFPIEMLPTYNDFLGLKSLSHTQEGKPGEMIYRERELSNEVSVDPPGGPVVLVRVYPPHQTVRPGQDVVIQCRDEGELRTRVSWTRSDGDPLPASSFQSRGRLELYSVREEEGGEYTCRSVSLAGEQRATVEVRQEARP